MSVACKAVQGPLLSQQMLLLSQLAEQPLPQRTSPHSPSSLSSLGSLFLLPPDLQGRQRALSHVGWITDPPLTETWVSPGVLSLVHLPKALQPGGPQRQSAAP